MITAREVEIVVNGALRRSYTDVRLNLADFLRDNLGLHGTRVGCEHGICGACTVLFDGASVRSCIMLAVQAHGHSIETVEGLAGADGGMHPLQRAFQLNHALQCGYCTPGMLMTSLEFLREFRNPSELEVRNAISGNLCRCTGYQGIVEAIMAADVDWQWAARSAGTQESADEK
jgi:carbon-monoxide dehydrogenase small subunit